MKKNYLKLISTFLLATLIITGCQKEIKGKQETKPGTDLPSAKERSNSGCRLIYEGQHYQDFSYSTTFGYNSVGLVNRLNRNERYDKYNCNISYHPDGRLKSSEVELIQPKGKIDLHVDFGYSGNNLTRTTWTFADNGELINNVYLSYNADNQLKKIESPEFDFSVEEFYNTAGDLIEENIYIGGIKSYIVEYKYTTPIKNPWLLIKDAGVPYDFVYNVNSIIPKLENAGSNYYFDGTDFILYYQEDINATTFKLNKNAYPEVVNYFDIISQEPTKVVYNYTNCDNGNSSENSIISNDVTTESNLSKLQKIQAIKTFQTKHYLF